MSEEDSNVKKVIGIMIAISMIGIFAYIFIFTGSSMGEISGTNAAITNGGFETGDLTGWTSYAANGSVMVDASAAHSGSYGANLTVTGGP